MNRLEEARKELLQLRKAHRNFHVTGYGHGEVQIKALLHEIAELEKQLDQTDENTYLRDVAVSEFRGNAYTTVLHQGKIYIHVYLAREQTFAVFEYCKDDEVAVAINNRLADLQEQEKVNAKRNT